MKLVFVHGIGQQGKDPKEIKNDWLDSINDGLRTQGLKLPENLKIALPYYGDKLYELTQQADMPLTDSTTKMRGGDVNADYLMYCGTMLEEMRQHTGVTIEMVNAEYDGVEKDRGPQNWGWVHAIAKALDKVSGIRDLLLSRFLKDTYIYTRSFRVRDIIDDIVGSELTEDEPMIIIGHSLGTVVSYNILRNDKRKLTIPLYLTVGSPLAVRYIRDQLVPLSPTKKVNAWYNVYDDRDIVSLYPLDNTNFPVKPPRIENEIVKNSEEGCHGIKGYLSVPSVARCIYDKLK